MLFGFSKLSEDIMSRHLLISEGNFFLVLRPLGRTFSGTSTTSRGISIADDGEIILINTLYLLYRLTLVHQLYFRIYP